MSFTSIKSYLFQIFGVNISITVIHIHFIGARIILFHVNGVTILITLLNTHKLWFDRIHQSLCGRH